MRSLSSPYPYATTPLRRKNRASVAPTIRNGTVSDPGTSFRETFVSVSQSGERSGDSLAGLSPSATISMSFQSSSPIASRSIFRTPSRSSPAMVRMSMSISALSGMTLSLTPERAMFGENVVRVAA